MTFVAPHDRSSNTYDITSFGRGSQRPSRELQRTAREMVERQVQKEMALRAERSFVEKKNDALEDAALSAMQNIHHIGTARFLYGQSVDPITQTEMLEIERVAATAIGRNIRDFGRWE